jgi:hypothetical protein
MITIIRSMDQSIKSFCTGTEPTCDAALGESVEYLNTNINEYANRLILSTLGKTGVTLSIPHGEGGVTVNVSCPGHTSIDLTVNGTVQTVALVNGAGELALSTETPGIYVIAPADRTVFCAAGNGLLCVEVTD